MRLWINSILRSSRFLSFSRRRSNKRAKKRASEGARLGWAKNRGEVRRGEKEGGGVGEKRNRRFLGSPHPLPLLLNFRTPSQFRFLRVGCFSHSLSVSFPSRKFLETPATRARYIWYMEKLWPRSWKCCPRPQAEDSILKLEVTVFPYTDRP